MTFKKQLIKRNENNINSEIIALKYVKDYFQKYVDRLTALNFTAVDKDLELLFNNPKAYITEKLTEGQSVQFGSIKIAKEKIFDLLEKPEGVNAIISDIEKDLADRSISEYCIWKVNQFEVKNNEVVLTQETLDFISDKNSWFISSENQKKGFEKLKQIADIMNEINQLEGKKINSQTEIGNLFQISEDKVFEVKLDTLYMFS